MAFVGWCDAAGVARLAGARCTSPSSSASASSRHVHHAVFGRNRRATSRRSGNDARMMAASADSYVVLCPGQGAQALGMCVAWGDSSARARAALDQADAWMKEQSGGEFASLTSMIRDGPKEMLDRTNIAQPAIFAASMACWYGMQDLGLAPGAAAQLSAAGGLSLGEYTALVVGGAIDYEDAFKLVALRGKAMQDAADASVGGMAALIGADEDVANEVVAAGLKLVGGADPTAVLVAANFNAPGQVVISGSKSAVASAVEFGEQEKKLRVVTLDVAGAFHSPLMAPAAERLKQALADTVVRAPKCTVLSNVTGKPHDADPDQIRKRLVEQLTSPVRWEACVRDIIASAPQDASWIELCPGKTLSGMMRKIDRKRSITSYDTPPAPEE